jgi:hypothetical protein
LLNERGIREVGEYIIEKIREKIGEKIGEESCESERRRVTDQLAQGQHRLSPSRLASHVTSRTSI